MTKQPSITTEEKRRKKIAELKARLQKEEARLSHDKRKERTGQLVAFGILVEEIFKAGDETERQRWIDGAKKHLTDRNLTRVISGFSRLQGE